MTDDKKNSPLFAMKSIPLFKAVKITLDCSKPIKTGETQYGTWYLWAGKVENQTVSEGRGNDKKEIKGYTGDVIFFPTEKISNELEKLANGNENVEVSIIKEAEETQKGLIKRYKVEKISEGGIPQSLLTPSEDKLLKDVGELEKDGYPTSLTDFITISKDEEYGEITEDRAKELFKSYKRV